MKYLPGRYYEDNKQMKPKQGFVISKLCGFSHPIGPGFESSQLHLLKKIYLLDCGGCRLWSARLQSTLTILVWILLKSTDFFQKVVWKEEKSAKKENKNIYLLSIVEKAKWKKSRAKWSIYYNLRHLQVTNLSGYLTIVKDMQITKLISVFEGNYTISW